MKQYGRGRLSVLFFDRSEISLLWVNHPDGMYQNKKRQRNFLVSITVSLLITFNYFKEIVKKSMSRDT